MTGLPRVLVRKRPLLEEFAVPAVRYVVGTDGTEPIRVRLVESLPRSVDEIDIGFTRDGENDAWSVRDRETLVYETTVERGVTRRTEYAVATNERHLCRMYMDEPAVEVAEPSQESAATDAHWQRVDEALDFRSIPASRLTA